MHATAPLRARLSRANTSTSLLISVTTAILLLTADAAQARGELAELFATPTTEEILAAQAIWDARDSTAHGWTVEAASVMDGFQFLVVSHVITGGYRHYAGIRFPRNHIPGQRYPVLLKCHGDYTGANIYDLTALDNYLPSDCLRDNYIIAAPTYRGEPLDMGPLGYYQSGGPPSVNDFDVDDALATLDGVLRFIPEADTERVAVYGGSRGGTVACRVGAREPRVALAIVLFGQYDYFLPSLQAEAENILLRGGQATNQVSSGLMTYVVWPWYMGLVTTEEARQMMVLRSTVYFAEPYANAIPRLRLHHGVLDGVIPVAQADRLNERLLELGASAPGYIYHRYPTGSHSPATLPGLDQYIDRALCQLIGLGLNPRPADGDGLSQLGLSSDVRPSTQYAPASTTPPG